MPVSPTGERVLRWSVRQISSRWDRRRFRRFPAWLYRDDRYWVPPLPGQPGGCFPAGLTSACFLAETTSMIGEDHIAGSVLVFRDPGFAGEDKDEIAWFGFFEVVNYPDVAADLMDMAQTWIGEHIPGAVALRGPASPYPWGGCGLLTDGFNARPAAFTPYNAPYYPEFLSMLEFEPAEELQAFRLDLAARELPERTALDTGITIRPAHPDSLHSDLAQLAALLAGQDLGGVSTVALDEAGWAEALSRIADHLDLALCFWVERDTHLIGAILALPDLNEPAAVARAWPFPLNRLRAAIARRHIRRAHAFPPFIRRGEPGRTLAAMLYGEVAGAAVRRGFLTVEYGPLPTGNRELVEPLLNLGARPTKSYVVYEKALA